MIEGNNTSAFVPLAQMEGKHFEVKDYQRGYKWEKLHIDALLNDIYGHNEGKYCLQPIIVKKQCEAKEVYELIDGQQRLTSLYLLFYYLTKEKKYTLSYQTREATKGFLDDKLEELDIAIKDEKEWFDFVTHNSDYDNVDIYHVYEVYRNIHLWFDGKEKEFRKDFTEKLTKQVYVIWYETSSQDSTSAEDVFLNLNAGKVPLTNSELIKALFILDITRKHSPEVAKLKSYALAGTWDRIENKLQDDQFWYFICNQPYYQKLDTRIDFLLDLANNRLVSDSEKAKETYLVYEESFRNNKRLDWETVNQTYQKLLEWYESKDKEIFHHIGFLINTGIKDIVQIITESKGKNKAAFKKALLNLIKKELSKTKTNEEVKPYDIDNLHYEDHRKECQNILLLFNIVQYINDKSNHKFPFDLYNKEKWSVEHINPQNPKGLEHLKDVHQWLESVKSYYGGDVNDTEDTLFSKITKFKEQTKDLNEQKTIAELRLKQELTQLLHEISEHITALLSLHEIGNLALLDKNTNSALGNRPFLEKRKNLWAIHFERGEQKEKKAFIPRATLDVFSKSFTGNTETFTDEIFSMKDMKAYKDYLQQKLQHYYNSSDEKK